ncbi:recombinase family protein [Pelosinus propionicus]|uniref:Site-specific DNA recombinase n=1 Tax=Pelosinus propionicus DSM 13327 TaxID=1123291 RepID=A0A1I4QFI7_9FIRM|nr:recombinase family protein [Pelosinus propionicus]SFM38536.1 Site-specific DNA recombinase [Pelosinus propionicus DSM 13327]
MANVAYIRVSTVEQNEGRQREMMKAYNIDETFTEKLSGKDMDRPQLQAMIKFARKGDTIYIESFSRLARNTKDLLTLIDEMTAKGIKVISLKEGLDTSTPSGKLMLTMIGAIAEFERENMLERQREGIALAKKEGKYKGRQEKKAPDNFLSLFHDYQTRKLTKVKLAEICGVSRPVLDKWIAEHEEKVANGVLF